MLAEEFAAASTAAPPARSATPAGTMTLRERFRRTMHFQRVDRIPNWEFGYWSETLAEWHRQGLPPEVHDEASAYRWFGIEPWGSFVPVNTMGLIPGFPWQKLAEDDEHLTYRGHEGEVARINKRGHKSIPHFLRFPITDRASWEAFREHLRPGPQRLPADWPAGADAFHRSDVPVLVGIGSLIGQPRNWIGFETIALWVHDEPALLEEIVDTCCTLVCDSLARVLPEVEVDYAMGWEDICFNSGPIVGVRFMRDVVAPRYRRITGLLAKHGCHLATTDCDGDITPIVDCFRAGGITTMFPVEVHGGSDPVALRRRWRDLRLQGGFDKMALTKGRAAIRAELERLLPVVREGGFIPGVDHRVQAGVRYDDYRYYLKLKRALFGAGGTPQYDESGI